MYECVCAVARPRCLGLRGPRFVLADFFKDPSCYGSETGEGGKEGKEGVEP